MSRFALEWSKIQPVINPADKLVLVILGDYAAGLNHDGTLLEAELGKMVGTTNRRLIGALRRLQSAGVLAFTYDDGAAGRRIKYSLAIPPRWRPSSAPGDRSVINVPTAVYRLYSTVGRLLYVGISDDPPTRLKQHKGNKSWWWEVVTREVIWYPDRHRAKAEEDIAIATEDPVYNGRDFGLVHRPEKRRPRLRYAHDTTGPARYEVFKQRFDEAFAAGKLDGANRLLLPISEIAKLLDVDAAFVIKGFEESREVRQLSSYEEQAIYQRREWY